MWGVGRMKKERNKEKRKKRKMLGTSGSETTQDHKGEEREEKRRRKWPWVLSKIKLTANCKTLYGVLSTWGTGERNFNK